MRVGAMPGGSRVRCWLQESRAQCGRCCSAVAMVHCCFFFQAEDGIRDDLVTGVQTCALPISWSQRGSTPRSYSLLLLRDLGVDPRCDQVRRAVALVRDNCRWEHAGQPFFAGEVDRKSVV